jgi:hypothetical protein
MFDNVVVKLWHNVGEPAIGAGSGLTVTNVVLKHPDPSV